MYLSQFYTNYNHCYQNSCALVYSLHIQSPLHYSFFSKAFWFSFTYQINYIFSLILTINFSYLASLLAPYCCKGIKAPSFHYHFLVLKKKLEITFRILTRISQFLKKSLVSFTCFFPTFIPGPITFCICLKTRGPGK